MRLLSPCPFCGCVEPKITNAMGEWWVCCPNCKASSDMSANYDAAVDAWCRRPPNQEVAIDPESKCSECDFNRDANYANFCANCGRVLG